MIEPNNDPKQRIFDAACQLFLENRSTESITTRQIAERAGVGIGLINYHYQSKAALLSLVYDHVFSVEVQRQLNAQGAAAPSPMERLRNLLNISAELVINNPSLASSSLANYLQQGGMELPLMLLPLLREIFAGQKDELTLRLTAFALVNTFQVAAVRQQAFESYMGIRFSDRAQWGQLVDQILNLFQFPSGEK